MVKMAEPVFKEPTRQILGVIDLAKWKKSQAYSDYMGFVRMMNNAVKSKSLTDSCDVSETCHKLIKMIDIIDGWTDDIPPLEQPQRFGNMAFRTWHAKLKENAEELIKDVLPDSYKEATIELKAYVTEGFGNYTRIDYGTGHEMNYAAFLCCLFKLRVLTEADSIAVVHHVFNRYLKFMRKLQLTYRMEPAGSQGVWGLDDFQFLPYIWGSSQLLGHEKLSPKDFVDSNVAESYKNEYMFMACIAYINEVKTGPFAEHSNQLWNISAVLHWTKVNSGLIKMYDNEVLGKFPVIQHFHFGNLMSIEPA